MEKKMKKITSIVASTGLSMFFAASVFANSQVRTIESSIVIENPKAPVTEKVIRITGPDKITYKVESTGPEIERITKIVEKDPNTVVSFNGEVIEESGTKVFRVKEWKEVTTHN